jgi:hypothetical protein
MRVGEPGKVALKYHRDRDYGFSLVYPETWHRFDLAVEGGRGVLYSEDPVDLATHLSIEARDLGTSVRASDLPTLRDGFLTGLRSVPGSRILKVAAYDVGVHLGVEARQLFDEAGQRRKRWVRLLHQGSTQVRLVFQARDAKQFAYWLPSLNPAMTGFLFDGGLPPITPGESAYEPDWLAKLMKPAEGVSPGG